MTRLALGLVILAAGCGTRPWAGEELGPRAVVLSTTERAEDSERLTKLLHENGYNVLRKSTTIERPHSSAAVYAMRDDPSRVEEIARFLREAGIEAEILPFPAHATGGNRVVIWLGKDAPTDADASPK
jgi:hypothetical protein